MQAADERMRELDRIRWRCRRGLLELDLVLAGFVRAEIEHLSAVERRAFMRLLEAADNDLWDWICRRSEPSDAELASLVGRLRSVRIVA